MHNPLSEGPVTTAGELPPYKLVLLVLILTEVLAAFESSMIYSALPKFYQLFNNPVGVGWVMTAYLLVSAACAALCSRLGDLYGRRKVLLWVVSFACLGSLISATANSLEGIIWGRAIQGAAGAVLPLCFGIAREVVDAKRLPFTIGVIGSSASIGAGIGFLLGGLIIDLLTWQWIFYTSAAMALFVLCLLPIVIPPSKQALLPGKLDLMGGVLFVPGIGMMLLGLSFGKQWGWSSLNTIGLLLGGLVMLVVWVWHELKLSNPLLNVRLLANRQVALANLGFFLLALGAMNVAQMLTVLLQQPVWTGVGLGLSASVAGALKFPSAVIAVFAGAWGGVLAGRHGGRLTMLIATGTVALAWVLLVLDHSSVVMVVGMMLVSGFGMTIAFGAVANLVVEVSPRESTSEATGFLQVTRAIGMAIGSQVTAVLMASSTVSNASAGPGRFPDAQAYNTTFVYVALVCLLSLLISWWLPRRAVRQ